jgi:hypothetical protein
MWKRILGVDQIRIKNRREQIKRFQEKIIGNIQTYELLKDSQIGLG